MNSGILKAAMLAIFGLILFGSCKQQHNAKIAKTLTEPSQKGIEVIYFFGKQKCSSCVAMEKFAKEAIDSVFPDKIKDGSIVFKSVDINTPEGEKLAELFEVSSSSLYIVNNNHSTPEKVDMTAFGFLNARKNRQVYKQGIIDQINKFLN